MIKVKQKVIPKEIDEVEALAFKAMEYMLNTEPKKLLKAMRLKDYQYHFNIEYIGARSDVVNKNIKKEVKE